MKIFSKGLTWVILTVVFGLLLYLLGLGTDSMAISIVGAIFIAVAIFIVDALRSEKKIKA
jgi:hypothetical protein